MLTDPPYGLAERWVGGTWFTRGVYKGSVAWDKEAPQDIVRGLTDRFQAIVWGGAVLFPPALSLLAGVAKDELGSHHVGS